MKTFDASILSSLAAKAGGPAGLDATLREAGMPPMLVNPFLATRCDLHSVGLGIAINIPIHIGPGGRKSLYELDVGETVLAYLVVTEERGMLFRYATRLTGNGPFADGDTYRVEIKTTDGEVLYAADGPVKYTDPSIGKGEHDVQPKGSAWILWSCIHVCPSM